MTSESSTNQITPVTSPLTPSFIRDRLQHGENVVTIVEQQLSTARHNIVLLQDQMHLASQTLTNLQQHVNESSRILGTFMYDKEKEYEGKRPTQTVDGDQRGVFPDGFSKDVDNYHGEKMRTSPYSSELRKVLKAMKVR